MNSYTWNFSNSNLVARANDTHIIFSELSVDMSYKETKTTMNRIAITDFLATSGGILTIFYTFATCLMRLSGYQ